VPARAAARVLMQICVHEYDRGHKFGCPLQGRIVMEDYDEGKTVVGGRLQ